MVDVVKVKQIAKDCRRGLESLANQHESMFYKFPASSCGPATEIVGRILKEALGVDGVYMCGTGHPDLKPSQTHAWFEIDGYIIDITHDQFLGTGLYGWVFKCKTEWHAKFNKLDPRRGFCMPSDWPGYPFDAYKAALEEVQTHLRLSSSKAV